MKTFPIGSQAWLRWVNAQLSRSQGPGWAPSFIASRTPASTIAAAEVICSWDRQDVAGGMEIISPTEFSTPKQGWYALDAFFPFRVGVDTDANSYGFIFLRVNGISVSRSETPISAANISSTSMLSAQIVDKIYLNEGDSLKFYVGISSGTVQIPASTVMDLHASISFIRP